MTKDQILQIADQLKQDGNPSLLLALDGNILTCSISGRTNDLRDMLVTMITNDEKMADILTQALMIHSTERLKFLAKVGENKLNPNKIDN